MMSKDDFDIGCPFCQESLVVPLDYIGVLECPLCKEKFSRNKNKKIIKGRVKSEKISNGKICVSIDCQKYRIEPSPFCDEHLHEWRNKKSIEEKEFFSLTINDAKKYLKESRESRNSVSAIYYATCLLLLFLGILGATSGDLILIISAIISFFSLAYFYQMWNNLSINTSFSNLISIDKFFKEKIHEEE